MNLKDLYQWAQEKSLKDNNQLLEEGVSPGGLSKVKNGLRQGIMDRCEIIFANTKKNNECMNEIQNQLQIMSKVGLKIPQEEKKVEVRQVNA